MSHTLRTITKIRSEGALLLHDGEHPGGSRLQTLSGRQGVMNLTLATNSETQGMVSNLWHD